MQPLGFSSVAVEFEKGEQLCLKAGAVEIGYLYALAFS
jgi:hypothetical protein